MNVRRKQVGGVVVLAPVGKIIGDEETDALETAFHAEASAGTTRLVVNLAECSAMNSTGLGVLVSARAEHEKRGARIKLCGLQTLIWQSKLFLIFDCHDTEDEAIAAFAASAE